MKRMIFSVVLLFAQFTLFYTLANAQTSLATLVDGILLSPVWDVETSGHKKLKVGISGFYYRYERSPGISLYFPYQIENPIQDALVNVTLEYGLFTKTEIRFILPYAPDWIADQGANKHGFTDMTVGVKHYIGCFQEIKWGVLCCSKFNTSSHRNNPFWYGTNGSNIFVRLILSITKSNCCFFLNSGFKKTYGAVRRYIRPKNQYYTYRNTWIGACGCYLLSNQKIQPGIESNFESQNKQEIRGYYWDLSGCVNVNFFENFQLFIKIGKKISPHAPDIFLNTGCSFCH